MFHRVLHLLSLCLLLGSSFDGTTAAATIDLFETSQSTEATVLAPPIQGTGSVANPTATALGTERDLFVQKNEGADGDRIRARINPLGQSKFRIDVDAEVQGAAYVTWDGVDGNPNPSTGIDFDGLGGIDLTNGATNNALEVVVSFSDVGGPIKFDVYDNALNNAASFASSTLSVPGGIAPNTPTPLTLPFSSFTGTTSALTNAGAILMTIDATSAAQAGWDINILSVQTVPEPGGLCLVALGVFGMLGCFERRRSDVANAARRSRR